MNDMKTAHSVNVLAESRGKLMTSLAINSYMLYPDSDDLRGEYISKTLFRYVADDNILAVGNGLSKRDIHNYCGVLLTQCVIEIGGWTKFYEWVTRFRKEPLEQDFVERLSRGIITGEILITALRNKISISAAIKRIVAENQKESKNTQNEEKLQIPGTDINFTESNLGNNIWPKYKKAAHLWASFGYFAPPLNGEVSSRVFIDIETLRPRDPKFPIGGVEGFLYLAGQILKSATEFKPPRSAKPLLDKKSAYDFFRGVTPA